jgi:protein CpxP
MIAARLSALALLAAVSVPALALAQGYAPPPPGANAPGPDGQRGPGDFRQRMQAHEAERMAALHSVLRIRADQDSAFQAFVAAMRPQPRTGERQPGAQGARGDMSQLTTPERLDRMAQMMDQREARRRAEFQRRATATKTLYAALDTDQRRVLDALPELTGGHGWGKGGGGGRMGHGSHGLAMGDRPMGPPPAPGA